MKIKIYIEEMQLRLFFVCLSYILNFITVYHYKEQIIYTLGQHQTTNFPHFIATNLPEIFLCLLKFSAYLALYCTFPVILIQSWFFFIPALYKYEYKIIRNFLALSLFFYFLSNFLLFTYLLPYCWEFFSGFQLNYEKTGISVQLEVRLYEYLNFFTKTFFSINLGLNFCLFLSFFLLKFPIYILTKLRKIIYFSNFITATLITPPDITSQIIIGTILIISYELFLFSLLLTNQYRKGE
jgi:sec-independent protein translocase protein TatC